MSGERNPRRDMEPSDDRLSDLALRVQLLSAQRPARAAECSGDADAARPQARSQPRVKRDGNG
jgi:hypothetical protein